ncbi:MAG: oligoribonuclease [Propionibacteriaceae bacterium]|nr:oligoribonuclease [Propionibacteriaceae bacterium]
MNDKVVWIDCEMTGLDLTKDTLVEVAVLVTDGELNVLGDGLDLIISTSEEKLAGMGDFVRTMHTTSGLLDEIRASTLTMREAEQQVLAYVREWIPEAGKAPLAGNTIGTDRSFLALDMPELESYLHYRNIDVSTIKELARRWYPKTFYQAPAKLGHHRALADIQESIEELTYYRATVFVPEPGPTSEQAHRAAQACQGSLTGLSPESAADN